MQELILQGNFLCPSVAVVHEEYLLVHMCHLTVRGTLYSVFRITQVSTTGDLHDGPMMLIRIPLYCQLLQPHFVHLMQAWSIPVWPRNDGHRSPKAENYQTLLPSTPQHETLQ